MCIGSFVTSRWTLAATVARGYANGTPSVKKQLYVLCDSHLTTFLVDDIHIYDFKLIYYKNTFRN